MDDLGYEGVCEHCLTCVAFVTVGIKHCLDFGNSPI